MQPSLKDDGIERVIEAFSGKSRIDTIRLGKCMTCEVPNMQFVDALSRHEYTISGMCQTCQDAVFGEDPFDESMDWIIE